MKRTLRERILDWGLCLAIGIGIPLLLWAGSRPY